MLKIQVEHRGTGFKVDFDKLHRYGQYFVEPDRGLIIRADVYNQGTTDSRFVADTEVGTDYTFRPVDVDVAVVKETLQDDLSATISEDNAERVADYNQRTGCDVVDWWVDDYYRKRILSKATDAILSTDVEQPLWAGSMDSRPSSPENKCYKSLSQRTCLRAAEDRSRRFPG